MDARPPNDSDCLPDATLLAYAQGSLEASRIETARQHLAHCQGCRDTLAALSQSSADAETVVAWKRRLGSGRANGNTAVDAFSNQQFGDLLVQSSLLSAEEVAQTLDGLSQDESLLEALRSKNRLTDYQVDVLTGIRPGLLSLGSYEILEEIGIGGMGVVYKAQHRHMKRLVALKVLISDPTDDNVEASKRFQREVEAAARLHHFNIAAAFHAEEADGAKFLAMEFVDGPNLSQYVKHHGPFPTAIAVRLILQAARGLAHSHHQGVVHRDIKPSNLAVTRQGVVKILDMGLAQLRLTAEQQREDLTQTGRVMGTVDFMAPEQAKNAKHVDARADIYSLGCTLHFLVTGKAMSPDGSLASKLLWHQVESAPDFREAVPDAPDILCECFRQAIAKKPEERQATMDDVVEQLAEALQELPEATFEFQGEPIHVGSGSATVAVDDEDSTLVDRPTRSGQNEDTINSFASDADDDGHPRQRFTPIAITSVVLAIALLIFAIVALPRFFGSSSVAKSPSPKNVKPALPDDASPTWVSSLETLLLSNESFTLQMDTPTESDIDSVERLAAINAGDRIKLANVAGVTGEQLRLLAAAPITALAITEAKLDAEGVAAIAGIKPLSDLQLRAVELDGDALYSLAGADQLRSLTISNASFDDHGLTAVVGLKTLERLDISGTQVSDQGAQLLAQEIPNLRQLTIRDTFITTNGRESIQAKHPDLRLIADSEDADRRPAKRLRRAGARLQVQTKSDLLNWIRPDDELPDEPFRVLQVDAAGQQGFGQPQLVDVALLRTVSQLMLGRSGVAADGWEKLNRVKTLRRIDLGAMRVAPEILSNWRQRRPDCEITFSPSPDQSVAQKVLACKGVLRGVTDEGESFQAATQPELPAVGDYWLTDIDVREADFSADDVAQFTTPVRLRSLALTLGEGEAATATLRTLSEKSLEQLQLVVRGQQPASMASLGRVKDLQSLTLTGVEVNNELLAAIGQLNDLQSLTLADIAVAEPNSDAWPAAIQSVQHLRVSGLPVGDAWAAMVARSKTLQSLDVRQTELTDAAVEELRAALPACQILSDPPNPDRLAARWALMNGGRVELADGPRTKAAQLPRDMCRLIGVDVSDVGQFPVSMLPEKLAACDNLKWLRLSDTRLDSATVARFPSTWPLEELGAANTDLDDRGLVDLKRFQALRILDLSGTSIRGSTLSQLPWESLHSIRLANTALTSNNLVHLAAGRELRTLDLNGVRRIGDQPLVALEGMLQLRELGLRSAGVTDRSLPVIRRLGQLQRLDIDDNEVSSSGLASLASLSKLTHLSMQQTGADDGTLSALAALPQLRLINALRTEVTEQGANVLKSARPGVTVQYSPRRPKDRRGNGRF